jgi:hypothetical protein
MAEFGWTVSVMVSGEGELIAGHVRLLTADLDGDAGDRAQGPGAGYRSRAATQPGRGGARGG